MNLKLSEIISFFIIITLLLATMIFSGIRARRNYNEQVVTKEKLVHLEKECEINSDDAIVNDYERLIKENEKLKEQFIQAVKDAARCETERNIDITCVEPNCE